MCDKEVWLSNVFNVFIMLQRASLSLRQECAKGESNNPRVNVMSTVKVQDHALQLQDIHVEDTCCNPYVIHDHLLQSKSFTRN